MKDLFVGIAIGAVAGAMIAGNPKTKRMMNDIKSKVKSGSCGCCCGEHSGQGGESPAENRSEDSGNDWQ